MGLKVEVLVYICRKCGKKFGAERQYIGHLSQCSKPKKPCSICGRELLQSVYSLHLRAHEKDTYCPVCGTRIYRRTKFCSIACGNRYNSRKALIAGGGNIREEIIQVGLIKKKIHVRYCLFCDKTLGPKARFYCGVKCQKSREWEIMKNKIIISGDAGRVNSASVKKLLIEVRGHVCVVCDRVEWNGAPIPLIMDHKDGNSENNLLVNLQLVCNNCNAQLSTHTGRNRGNGRILRRIKYREENTPENHI